MVLGQITRVDASFVCWGFSGGKWLELWGCIACRAVGRSAKLKEQVTTIDFQARSVAALLHHPFRPILVGVDGRGTVKVYSHRHGAFVNSFHLADDKWPMSVVNMWQLNELQVPTVAHIAASCIQHPGAVYLLCTWILPRSSIVLC